jgi:hypothetical protein
MKKAKTNCQVIEHVLTKCVFQKRNDQKQKCICYPGMQYIGDIAETKMKANNSPADV